MLTAVANNPPLTANPPPGAESRPACRLRRFNHWVDEIYYEGRWEVGPLRDALTGHISKDANESACTFTFEGQGLILQFWSHPWSGVADIEVDGARRRVDLFGESPAMKNIHFDGLTPGMHLARISGVQRQDGKPGGDQIVFHEAIVYDRLTEMVIAPAGQRPTTNKPARFNAIYAAPGPLTWAERTILYSMVFSIRPRNVLIVGTGQSGAAVIGVASLDDLGEGNLTCADADPNISPELWQKVGHRTALVVADGIEAIAVAQARSGRTFDFAFADESAICNWADFATSLDDDAIILLRTTSNQQPSAHADLIDGGPLVLNGETPGGIRLLRRRRRT